MAEVDPIVTKPLLEAAARQDERFVQRPQRLTQRHPCIKTLDDESKDAVWIEGQPFDSRGICHRGAERSFGRRGALADGALKGVACGFLKASGESI